MSSAKRQHREGFRPKLIALSVAACFGVSATHSLANPTGGTVSSGSASVASSGNTLTVTNSANAIINWQSFSIGVNEITQFLQSSSGSAVLNRVVGANGVIPQSVIDGVLSSNGRVFLLNQSGVVIGSTGRIDVAGFVASSLNLSDQDFLNGQLRFTEVPGAGGVSNAGVIQAASGGRVFLVAPNVENTGAISAPQGQIVLAAGKSVELVSEGSPFVTVRVTADAEQALNLGKLIADSGRIDMSGALVRQAGIAQADSAVVGANGEIRLVATKDLTLDAGSVTTANGPSGGSVLLQAQGGTNLISGTVEAKGSAGQGGTVQALGVRVGVIGNGVIDASGDAGGGTVLVGGDAHGANPDVQNAERTLIGPDGVIRADAQTTGDGGRVIVWADGDTRFYGSISARGGSQSGNGGFVETSGKLGLDIQGGRVDTRAPNGQWGTWLLDPTDVIIEPNSYANGDALLYASSFAIAPLTGPTAHVTEATVEAGFTTNGTVQIQATHDVNFKTDLNLSFATPGGLFEVRAVNNIDMAYAGSGAHTIFTNGQDVVLSANDVGPGIAGVPPPALNTTSGTGSIIGGGNIFTDYGGVVVGGNITLSGYGVNVGTLETKGGLNANLLQVGNVAITALYGGVQTGTITTHGIDGVNATTNAGPTAGGTGGAVTISAAGFGAVAVGNIDTGGGLGGTGGTVTPLVAVIFTPVPGASGGVGGSISISGTSIATGSISTRGGNGGNGVNATVAGAPGGGDGGAGGTVVLFSSGAATVAGSIDTSGGVGGYGGNSNGSLTLASVEFGGSGGTGGSVGILGTSISTGAITAVGGAGGAGGNGFGTVVGGSGGIGGSGGCVILGGGSCGLSIVIGNATVSDTINLTRAPVSTVGATMVNAGAINTSGGAGGTGGSVLGSGGSGGSAGGVGILGGSVVVGTITGRGGNGGAGGADNGIYGGGDGGSGGFGGFVGVTGSAYSSATGLFVDGPVTLGNVDVSGGSGGAGGKGLGVSAGIGGNGGYGGSVSVFGGSIDLSSGGVMMAAGGSGGAGGAGDPVVGGNGGNGGNGGFVDVFSDTTLLAPQIAINVSGGAGGAGGQDLGAGPGIPGIAGVDGTIGVFPVLFSSVSAAYNTIASGINQAANFLGTLDTQDKKKGDDKKGVAICK